MLFKSVDIDLITTESRPDAILLLRDKVKPMGSYRRGLPKQHIEFEGDIKHDKFEIQRIIPGRNSFLPKIKGVITDHNQGSKISLTIKLDDGVKAFLIGWLILVVAFLLAFLRHFDIKSLEALVILVPIFMLFAGTVVPTMIFKNECKMAIKEIKRILKAKDL